MEQKLLRLFIEKNLLYTLLILLAYLLQETPAPFLLSALRPVLVISVVTGIAMLEGEFSGGLFGLLGGMLCDTAVFHLYGVASIFFFVLGCTCGLLVIYLIRSTYKSAFLLAGAFALIYGLVSHYLLYGMWGYEGAGRLLLLHTLPTTLSTAAFGVASFWLIEKIHDYFEDAARK